MMRSILLSVGGLSLLTLVACAPKGPHRPSPNPVAASGQVGGDVSFGSIQPILANRCSSCHNPGKGLPDWNNQTVAESKRAVIALRVGNKSMPQPGSPEASQFTNEERAKILAWAQAGGGAPAPQQPDLKQLFANDKPEAHKIFLNRCATCHGANGTSQGPDFPNLASHDPLYITKRLTSFLKADSTSPMAATLTAILSEFGISTDNLASADELLKVAADHYSAASLEIKEEDMASKRTAFDPETHALYEKGKTLFVENACASCHLAQEGRPMEGAPMILGQPSNFLAKRLPELAASTDPENPMPGVLSTVIESDPKGLKALEVYLSNTLPSEVPPQP